YYALSQIYLIKNDFESSSESIQKAAELDPDNTWYLQELAYMFYETEDYANSVKSFGRLVEIEPRNIDWLYGYAEALVKNGETMKAVEALNKAEEQVGAAPQFSIQKYQLYIEAGDTEAAINELEKGQKKFPKDAQIIATMVDHYFRANQYSKAIEKLEELVVADPSNGRAHLALADIYRQQGRMDDAYRQLKEAFPLLDVDLDTKMQVLISIHDSQDKIDPQATELVDLLIQTYPDQAKPYSIKGDFLLKKGAEKDALTAYRKALEYDKTLYPIWNQVLIMEYQATEFELLYADSKECLELFPTMSIVYLLNGVSANQLKKHDEALESLVTGIELVINDPAMKAEFYGQIGEAYFGLKDNDEGITNYKKALSLDSKSNLLKNNFAFRLATAKKDLELAQSIIEQAVSSSPGQSQYQDTYGWVYFQQGKYDKAKAQFEKAYEINTQDRLILEHLGDVEYKLGNKSKAVEWWKKGLEIDPEHKLLEKKIDNQKYYEPE
ncbi:MAG: tetratricopeptide repeat protein, partial [Crocinitomicaceae bacterium]